MEATEADAKYTKTTEAEATKPTMTSVAACEFVSDPSACDNTCLHGYAVATRAQLEQAFGKPTKTPCKDGTVDIEWCLRLKGTEGDGVCVTIYDWKRRDSDELYAWHIGGDSLECAKATTRALQAVETRGFKCVSYIKVVILVATGAGMHAQIISDLLGVKPVL